MELGRARAPLCADPKLEEGGLEAVLVRKLAAKAFRHDLGRLRQSPDLQSLALFSRARAAKQPLAFLSCNVFHARAAFLRRDQAVIDSFLFYIGKESFQNGVEKGSDIHIVEPCAALLREL